MSSCALAGGSDLSARFLSLYHPPAYISGCSQAVWTGGEPVLIRNYDYSPALCDGLILDTRWSGQRVIASADCLWGCIDGMNEAGLAVSLSFGGRRAVGDGFRHPDRPALRPGVLSHSSGSGRGAAPGAVAHGLQRDQRRPPGAFFTAFLSPDRPAVIGEVPVATNHQGEVEWHRHARATASAERERFLSHLLEEPGMSAHKLADAFLRPPLYTRAYERGFGTLYTAIYRPARGEVEYRWPGSSNVLSFADFSEGTQRVRFLPQTA